MLYQLRKSPACRPFGQTAKPKTPFGGGTITLQTLDSQAVDISHGEIQIQNEYSTDLAFDLRQKHPRTNNASALVTSSAFDCNSNKRFGSAHPNQNRHMLDTISQFSNLNISNYTKAIRGRNRNLTLNNGVMDRAYKCALSDVVS